MNHYEIEACLIRAKNGNKEELLKILEQYKPFIIKTAKSFNIKNHDLYDMLQIGYATLINAVAKYRSGSNTFGTYAYNSIKNAFLYTYRQNSKDNGELSLNQTPLSDNGTSTEFIENIESPSNVEEDVINTERILELRKAVSKLPYDDMELILMVYYSGFPVKTYAEKKGLDYQVALRKRDRILKRLRIGMEG